MKARDAMTLGARYALLLLFGLFQLSVFYLIFTPLTVWPVFGILQLAYSNAELLTGNVIFFGGTYVRLVPACIAGAAYYLLLILNLATPMDARKRAYSLVYLFGVFLLLNIIRILVFAALAQNGYEYFDAAHELTWYFGSTMMIVVLWFSAVRLFRIREIPLYSDVRALYEDAVSERRHRVEGRFVRNFHVRR